MEAPDLEQCRALLEHPAAMFWRSDVDGRCNYVNSAWLTFTGRSFEEESGGGRVTSVHPDDVATYLRHFERRQPFRVEHRLRRFDGVYRQVSDHGVPYTDAAGTFSGFMGSSLDRGADEDRETSFGASDLFELSLDNVCIAGFDGYFKRVNPSWTRTLGWTAAELLATPSAEFVHPEDRQAMFEGRQRLHEGSHLGPLVNRYVCRDGSYRWFEWRSVADARRRLVYAVARDITEQKLAEERLAAAKALQEKMERQLIFADRMSSVGTLAGGMAHEINNPLALVAANLGMIVEELRILGGAAPSGRFAELSEMALDAQAGAERIRKIVRGLKTFSRAEEERPAVMDVHPLLDQSIDLAFNEIRHRAHLVRDYGHIPPVEADEARLGQVFINLLVNAAQAISEGASATNEIRVVTSTDEGGRAVIEVRDTGSGIPPSIIGRVFDPFFTTKRVGIGTGLGLSICHNIVAAMGGEISVTSTQGKGTSFVVALLPAVGGEVRPTRPAPARVEYPAFATVLVVDDEPSVGAALCRILRGHEVTVVTMATQALELLRAGRRFDIILSDLMMPEMSGMDFYDEIVRTFPDAAARVVFVSGGAFTPRAHAFLDRVPNQRIDKPFDFRNLREIVQRSVQSPRTVPLHAAG